MRGAGAQVLAGGAAGLCSVRRGQCCLGPGWFHTASNWSQHRTEPSTAQAQLVAPLWKRISGRAQAGGGDKESEKQQRNTKVGGGGAAPLWGSPPFPKSLLFVIQFGARTFISIDNKLSWFPWIKSSFLPTVIGNWSSCLYSWAFLLWSFLFSPLSSCFREGTGRDHSRSSRVTCGHWGPREGGVTRGYLGLPEVTGVPWGGHSRLFGVAWGHWGPCE